MIKTSLVSIVMPTYNRENFIEKSLNDILDQDYPYIEFIIVDDGSTDNTEHIVKKYKSIKYIKKENGGTGSALNLGFSLAKGKYGTWVSDDNRYYSNFISSLVNILEQYGEKFVFSSFHLDGKEIGAIAIGRDDFIIVDNFLEISLNFCITGICYLFDMNLKRECGDYILDPGEDYLMAVQMASKTSVGFLNLPLGEYISHPGTVTSKYVHKQPLLGAIKAREFALGVLSGKNRLVS